MNMKKLIATALAVVMIFGLVSVGFAATSELPDIEGYEFEAEVRRLASLGVIAGYPDGTFRPEDPVTRAEFAKMIVVMLGLENAANLMKGQAVSFSDVSANHWASGYINVAEMKGVVNGYPDGTFKPEASITYAEALKMILTAMGYLEDGFVVLRWPTTWIIQAAEIGLDEGVEVLADLPITRGEVAKLFDNSLTIPHVKVGEYGFETIGKDDETKHVTFMAKLGVKSFVGQVIDSPELWDNESGKVEVKPSSGNSMSFTTEDYEGLYGHKVKVWYKSTSNVLAIDDLSTEKALTRTEYNKITNKGDLEFFVNYTKAENVSGTVYYNGNAATNKFDVSKADEIVAVYSGSTPIAVKAVKYTVGTVESVYPYASAIYVKDDLGTHRLNLGSLDEVIYQGAAEKFADIKEGDAVHYIYDKGNGHAILIVVRDTYTGKLVEIAYDGKLKIDDKVFTPISTLTVSPTLVGQKITVYLNKDGKVFRIAEQAPAVGTFYGIVQAVSTKLVGGTPVDYAKFLTVDGEVEYRIHGTCPTVGSVVKVSLYDTTDDIWDDVTCSSITPAFGSDANGVPISKVVDKVYETGTRGVWTNNTLYPFVEGEVLWAEKTSAGYVQRPRPYPDDEVVLYVDINNNSVVKVGIVK